MIEPLTWTLYKSGSQIFPGSYDLVVGEACIARVVPITRFSNKMWAVRSLEANLHMKLFHSSTEAAEAMMQLINWDEAEAEGDAEEGGLE